MIICICIHNIWIYCNFLSSPDPFYAEYATKFYPTSLIVIDTHMVDACRKDKIVRDYRTFSQPHFQVAWYHLDANEQKFVVERAQR